VRVRPSRLAPRPARTSATPTSPTHSAPAGGRGSARVPCANHAVGAWGFYDQTGLWNWSLFVRVQVWDTAAGQLATGQTSIDAPFDICFAASPGHQVYIRVLPLTGVWRVQANGHPYAWVSAPVTVRGAGPVSFGTMTTADPRQFRALHAFD